MVAAPKNSGWDQARPTIAMGTLIMITSGFFRRALELCGQGRKMDDQPQSRR